MKDFYNKYVKAHAERLKEYISGEEFASFFKSVNGGYLCENYYDYFVRHTVGGKCLRAYLVNLFCRLFGGTPVPKAEIAFELFESAVLMHDDIIDRGRERRGAPSAYVALGDDHIGKSRAICLGDAGLLTATAIIDEDGFPPAVRRFIRGIFLRTISGELMDVDVAEKREVCDNEVIAAYIEKTATYTILGPVTCGAMLATDPDEKTKNLLRAFALDCGVAFQIKDDLLGIYGDKNETGKNVDSDIAEGKKTLLVSHFDRVSDKNLKESFYAVYGKGRPEEKNVRFICEALEHSGSKEYAEKQMNLSFDRAEKTLCEIVLKAESSTAVGEEAFGFIEYLRNRQK